MNNVVFCLGSNLPYGAPERIKMAVSELERHGCEVISSSDIYVCNSQYSNLVARVVTAIEYNDLLSTTKAIERALGRAPEMKARGEVPIDIDIMVWNGNIIRPDEYDAPYFQQGYKQI